jgi:hypothetical protein
VARQKKTDEINLDSMTAEESFNLLQFTQAMDNVFRGYGYYNPFSQRQNMLELNNDALVPTYDKILKALKSVPYDYRELARYSEFMEVFDSIYANTLRYMKGLLSFDLSYTCKNIKDPSEYQSKEYKDDLRRVHKFLDSFDYKQEFSNKILPILLRDETAFTWFRDSYNDIEKDIDLDDSNSTRKSEKFALQIMPQNYCQLTGYYDNSGLLYDFDVTYFMKGNVDIGLYPKALIKKYRDSLDSSDNKYIPSSQLNKRTGEFATWVQTSPLDGAYAFKMDMSNFRQLPPFAQLMKTCINNQLAEELQDDKDWLSARAFIFGTIRLFDNAKSGTQKNQWAIDPKTLGTLMGLVSNSLKKNVQPLAMPTSDNKMEFYEDKNPNSVSNKLSNSAKQGASAYSMVYTSDKMMQFELQQAIEGDYQFMAQLYEQFNAFMNFFVNKKTRKYKFNFEFNGCTRSFQREERRKALNELTTLGLTPNTSYFASVYGIKPQTFERMLEEAHYGDLTSKLTMLMNKNTMSGVTDNGSGRPTADYSDMTDNGATAREYQ